MSLAWYISTEGEVAGLDTSVDGKSIAHANEKKLEEILRSLGVKPFTEFFSTNPDELAALFGDFEEDAAGSPYNFEEAWFSAEEGLATVKALLNYLNENRDEFENQDFIIGDLEEYQRILEVLVEKGVRWHLSIDI